MLRFAIAVLCSFCFVAGARAEIFIPENLAEHEVSTEELAQWPAWGASEVYTFARQLVLRENGVTKGFMVISPDSYGGDVVITYDVLALTSATVIVNMIAMSDSGSSELTIPEQYDGNNKMRSTEKDAYFFAFKNAPHGTTPFVRRNPGASSKLAQADENVMNAGAYYAVRVAKIGGDLSLAVNSVVVFEGVDAEPLDVGHVSFRIRGVKGFPAAIPVKNVRVYAEK